MENAARSLLMMIANNLQTTIPKCEAIKYVLLAFVFQLITVWLLISVRNCGNEMRINGINRDCVF